MEKRTTVKDVAKAAGVSVATVSYIMNDKPGQKISEDTKKKVLQIANLLNYTPSYAAKSLATGRNNMIGISYHLNKKHPSRNMETTNFISMLIERFNRMHYDVIYIPFRKPDEVFKPNQRVDAVIAVDLSDEEFRRLADSYLVPVISNDILVDDFLFYQIFSDIPAQINKIDADFMKDAYLVLEPYNNDNYTEYITAGFSHDRIIAIDDLQTLDTASLRDKKLIVLGTYLSLFLMPYIDRDKLYVISTSYDRKILPENIKHYNVDLSKKANMTINITLNAIDRRFDIEHKYGV